MHIICQMFTRLVLVTLLVTAGAACKHNKHANTTVRHRAMFDMGCRDEELTLTVIDTEGARNLASQIAVRGCGQKAVYVYYPDSDTWLIDGIVTPIPEGHEVPPHVTKGKDKKKEDKKAARAEKKGKMNRSEEVPAEVAPAVEPVPAAPEAPIEAASDPS